MYGESRVPHASESNAYDELIIHELQKKYRAENSTRDIFSSLVINMATSLPKKEDISNRIVDNSFPQKTWLVKRVGNDNGRFGKPCLACAAGVAQAIKGYDEDYDIDNKFQMFDGLEGFDDRAEAEMFMDPDLENIEPARDAHADNVEQNYLLVQEAVNPIESFFPDEYPPVVARCPPPPPMHMPSGCGDCASSPCACEHRHAQRCTLAGLALLIALIALAALYFKKK